MIRNLVRVIPIGALVALALAALGAIQVAPAFAVGEPTVTLTSTEASTTSLASIPITVTFSEPVSGFSLSSSSVSTTNATVDTFAGGGANFTFNLHPTSSGTTTVKVNAGAATSTASSTPTLASNTLSFMFSASTSTAPILSNINVSTIGSSTATINWTTDQMATGQVLYGTTTAYSASSTLQSTASTTHAVMLSGLQAATLYHFAVQSSLMAGSTTATTTASTTAISADMTFTTASATSTATTTLAVTGIDAIRTTATPNGNFSDGWKWIMHLTVPSLENAFRMKFADWTSPNSSSTIPAANNIRIFSPQSSNASTSATAISATSTNMFGDWLLLTGNTSTTTPGRHIDLTIEVRVPSGTPAGAYSTTFTAQSTPSTATSTASQ